jgi:hypothetical protein
MDLGGRVETQGTHTHLVVREDDDVGAVDAEAARGLSLGEARLLSRA